MRHHRSLQIFVVACTVLFGVSATAETMLKVMTFNIRYGSAGDGPNAWEHRKDLVVRTVESYDPDILGTQECLDFQAEYLGAGLHGYERIGLGRNADGSGERMEVFYKADRLAALESGHFWLSETPDRPGSRSWRSANIRMATWARFYDRESKHDFFYINTHLDHRSVEARAEAARLLARWIRQRPKGAPVVLTGDFNAKAQDSEPWTVLTRRLNDAWLAASERQGPEVTWSDFTFPENVVNRIDWILVSPSISVRRCETVTYNENGRFPSDHFPVFSFLEFP